MIMKTYLNSETLSFSNNTLMSANGSRGFYSGNPYCKTSKFSETFRINDNSTSSSWSTEKRWSQSS